MAKKILIVDDDPIIVKYLQTFLADNGYLTCTAAHGLEAFDMLQVHKPDLITLDLQMAEEWGPHFYRRLAKSAEFKDIPIIVISGLAGQHAIKKAVAFVRKPFDPQELLGIIRKTFGENTPA